MRLWCRCWISVLPWALRVFERGGEDNINRIPIFLIGESFVAGWEGSFRHHSLTAKQSQQLVLVAETRAPETSYGIRLTNAGADSESGAVPRNHVGRILDSCLDCHCQPFLSNMCTDISLRSFPRTSQPRRWQVVSFMRALSHSWFFAGVCPVWVFSRCFRKPPRVRGLPPQLLLGHMVIPPSSGWNNCGFGIGIPQ